MPDISPARADAGSLPQAGVAPRIMVCICTHNRPDYLRDCLDGLRAQTIGLGGFDILVVDSASAPAPAARIAALVAGVANARLLRVDRLGLSLARNVAARAVGAGYIAYLDDDAIPSPDWIAAIQCALSGPDPAPVMLAGAILPLWEAPLPAWWPPDLRGVLSIIEIAGTGEFRRPGMAARLEPYGANMIIHAPALLAQGGFLESIGRHGEVLLSDEEKVLAWRLQDGGGRVLYDSRITVHHQIQAARLTMAWLLSRMYWQGVSHVRSARYLGHVEGLRMEAMRRFAIVILLAPLGLIPVACPYGVRLRWRWAYARGFLRAFLRPGEASARKSGSRLALAVPRLADP